jgi:putative Holliday junction resolvase
VTDLQGRVLALDLGEVRVGLALSDPLGITAQPLPTLQRTSMKKDLRFLDDLVRERGVVRVVVGLPLMLSGEEGPGAVAAREFAERLDRRLDGVEIELWDERLTSVEAERTMLAADVSRKKRKQSVDAMAAVLILQSYMDATGGGLI